jgi:hypothetical protein
MHYFAILIDNMFKKKMKRYLAILTAALLIGSLYSCKPREKCPAYGYKPATTNKTVAS